MLSWSAWVYIRRVTALSLWPKASLTEATSAPLVMAILANVCPYVIINHPSAIITFFRLKVNTLFQIKIYSERGDLLCTQESVICVRMLI